MRGVRRPSWTGASRSSTSGSRLEEAYLYEQALDRDAYMRHSDRLSEESALVLLGRHDAELDGLDVEALVNYAEYLALNPARLWHEADPEQKCRLPAFQVPSGLTWDGERFGTVARSLFFSSLFPQVLMRGAAASSSGTQCGAGRIRAS
jgi:hypothetical protein